MLKYQTVYFNNVQMTSHVYIKPKILSTITNCIHITLHNVLILLDVILIDCLLQRKYQLSHQNITFDVGNTETHTNILHNILITLFIVILMLRND